MNQTKTQTSSSMTTAAAARYKMSLALGCCNRVNDIIFFLISPALPQPWCASISDLTTFDPRILLSRQHSARATNLKCQVFRVTLNWLGPSTTSSKIHVVAKVCSDTHWWTTKGKRTAERNIWNFWWMQQIKNPWTSRLLSDMEWMRWVNEHHSWVWNVVFWTF